MPAPKIRLTVTSDGDVVYCRLRPGGHITAEFYRPHSELFAILRALAGDIVRAGCAEPVFGERHWSLYPPGAARAIAFFRYPAA